MNVLEVEDLSVTYGEAVRALHGVSVRVEQGQTVAVIGANGAGKTTLVRAITGVLPGVGGRITGGTVRHAGTDVTGVASRHTVRRGIGQIPEGRILFAGLSVEDNLRAGALGRRGAEVTRDFDQVYEAMPRLRERRTQRAGFLSGGEQQMLAIGRALMGRPTLLLSDELSLGLAPTITRSLYELVAERTRTLGMSWLIIEQNATLALEHSTHGYVMESGVILGEGGSHELESKVDLSGAYLGG